MNPRCCVNPRCSSGQCGMNLPGIWDRPFSTGLSRILGGEKRRDFSHRRKQAVLGAVNRRCWAFGLPSTGSSGRCGVNLPKILDRPPFSTLLLTRDMFCAIVSHQVLRIEMKVMRAVSARHPISYLSSLDVSGQYVVQPERPGKSARLTALSLKCAAPSFIAGR